MNDQEKLEKITECFIQGLIHYKLDDLQLYLELAKRLAHLIDAEIAWRGKYEHDRELMNYWYPTTN